VTLSYWQAQSVRSALDEEFLKIKSEEAFWNYLNFTFGPQFFSDESLSAILSSQ
jgi:hypothetical protein